MGEALANAADAVWSYPVVALCLLSAAFFTVRFAAIQVRALPHAIAVVAGRYDRPDETGTLSHFQALSAALSGTIGIGNIAGVAIAIAIGGPGSVLWMWVVGALGMATKFVECTLGTAYRRVDAKTGEVRGGPMVYIVEGLGPRWRPVAAFYGLTLGLAAFGFCCMFQSNQAADALRVHFSIPGWATGAALALLTGMVILGGIRSIGRWAARIVPLMCAIYLLGALVICVLNFDALPAAVWLIVSDGFTGNAAAGGATGAVIGWGVRRAIFSNEAGLGSASIAHATVKTDEPVREGIVASLGPLIDTIIVSGATAVVIILSGHYGALTEIATDVRADLVTAEQGWWQGDVAPQDEDGMRTFVDDEPWHHPRAKDDSAALQFVLPYDPEAHDGIRFAYHRGGGQMRTSLTDAAGDPIAHERARPCAAVGAWSACTLTPTPTESGPVYLTIRAARPDDAAGSSPELWITAPVAVESLRGISLSSAAFDRFLPGFGSIFVSIAGFLFAFSTMITWSYYGETASASVLGERVVAPYRIAFIAFAFIGAVRKLDIVIAFSDLLVGILVVPNVIAVLALSPKVAEWSRDYFERLRSGAFDLD
jgi:AGCS family alanine or glycine:cation symporter